MEYEIKIHNFLNKLLIIFDKRRNKVRKELEKEIKKLHKIAEDLYAFEQRHLEELQNIFPDFVKLFDYPHYGFLGSPINQAFCMCEQYDIKYIRKYFSGFKYDTKDKEEKDIDMYHAISIMKETGSISIEDIAEKTSLSKKIVSASLNCLLEKNIWRKYKCENLSGYYYCPSENYNDLKNTTI